MKRQNIFSLLKTLINIKTKSLNILKRNMETSSNLDHDSKSICLATTFKRLRVDETPYYTYIGERSPTLEVLQQSLAPLENAKHATCFSSGSSTTTTLCYFLKSGDHVIVEKDAYYGTRNYFTHLLSNFGVRTSFLNTCDLASLESAIDASTRMVWIETPTNPLLKICDIRAICELVKSKQPNAIIVADNTFCTPIFQSPLEFGVDIVVHSITKYINGHNDVAMGVAITNNDELNEKLRFFRDTVGIFPSPFDCFLAHRGLITLKIRMKQHMENALQIAKALEANPKIVKCIYPALESHPQHELYKRQMKGFSSIVSFYIKGGIKEAHVFLDSLKIFTLGESLGGTESLIKNPGLMNHPEISLEIREKMGIGDNFFRISVGLEDAQDLINDLYQALDKAIPN